MGFLRLRKTLTLFGVQTKTFPLSLKSFEQICVFSCVYCVCSYRYDGVEQLRSVERYDIETDQWAVIENMTFPRSAVNCAVFEGCIYVMGLPANFMLAFCLTRSYITQADTAARSLSRRSRNMTRVARSGPMLVTCQTVAVDTVSLLAPSQPRGIGRRVVGD